jgi:iron complex transport system ATP-binding protein
VLLEVRNLTCGYGVKVILREIDFQLRKGELLGIIGPNGSGKTTLLRAITKVIRPMGGVILFEGRDIKEISYKELARKLSIVSQNHETGWMGVEEFVLLGRIPYYRKLQFLERRDDLEIVRRRMRLTGTIGLKDRLLGELSGGERQLVHLARALTQEPELLLLDEPTAHLDITHQVIILDLIRKLNKEFGLTVVMVLHDLNLASEYCQRLILINDGRVYRDGPPEEVLSYKIVEEVYKTVVVVEKNPITGRPYVFLVPEDKQKRMERRWEKHMV